MPRRRCPMPRATQRRRSTRAGRRQRTASTQPRQRFMTELTDLPGGETVRNVARATADRLGSSAEYVRSHDAKRMMADVESFVKSNPGPALAVAAAFGFLLGRALSRD